VRVTVENAGRSREEDLRLVVFVWFVALERNEISFSSSSRTVDATATTQATGHDVVKRGVRVQTSELRIEVNALSESSTTLERELAAVLVEPQPRCS
jgi:hypothetical protein